MRPVPVPMRRSADPFTAWARLGMDMWMLGAESSSVIALRGLKLAAGGAAASDEAHRMVAEKVTAATTMAQQMMLGQLGTTMPGVAANAVASYRRKVRANRRRLAKPRGEK